RPEAWAPKQRIADRIRELPVSHRIRNRKLGTNTQQRKIKSAEYRRDLANRRSSADRVDLGTSPVKFGESPMERRFTCKIGFKPLYASRVISAVHESGLAIHYRTSNIHSSCPVSYYHRRASDESLLRLIGASPVVLVLQM
ncbi:hypothetical protein HAX54_007108, partial [Datura stramonium]|nr:hypothetical protein [Datura stramonium]